MLCLYLLIKSKLSVSSGYLSKIFVKITNDVSFNNTMIANSFMVEGS